MNILAFIVPGGSKNNIRPEVETLLHLAKLGHKLTVLYKEDAHYYDDFIKAGAKIIHQQPKRKICIESIKAIRRELKSKDYDIVYAANSKTIPNAAFACIGFPVKMINYRGTTGGLYRHDPTAYLTHLHPRVDGIICVSEAVKEDIQKQVWKNKKNVVRIYKGHDLAWYTKPPADLSEFGIKKDDFVLICAVNARPSKGIPVMIDAADQLADIPNLHLLLVGKNMEQYTDLISQNRMRARIHVTGYRYDAPELIVASDLLIQPSISGEGLPRAVMEAMGYGIPAVITTTGGGKEVVQNGVNGMIVPVNDPEAIANAVRELYQQPEKMMAMSLECKQAIAHRYSITQTAKQFEIFFERMINSRR